MHRPAIYTDVDSLLLQSFQLIACCASTLFWMSIFTLLSFILTHVILQITRILCDLDVLLCKVLV